MIWKVDISRFHEFGTFIQMEKATIFGRLPRGSNPESEWEAAEPRREFTVTGDKPGGFEWHQLKEEELPLIIGNYMEDFSLGVFLPR